MGNKWGSPCISHILKYNIGWESNGKKSLILWEKYECQFPMFSPLQWVLLHFPVIWEVAGKTHTFFILLDIYIFNYFPVVFLEQKKYIIFYPAVWRSNVSSFFLRARLLETRSELKSVWNLKPLWNVVPFTWQFTWRFHCGNFPNNSKALLHMCKCYLLINANLINAKKCYQW